MTTQIKRTDMCWVPSNQAMGLTWTANKFLEIMLPPYYWVYLKSFTTSGFIASSVSWVIWSIITHDSYTISHEYRRQ